MRIFFSAGEPSGDLHGSNLIKALRQLRPGVDCLGFGCERMAAEGCRLLHPMSQLAVMGILRILPTVPTFWRLLQDADRCFQAERPDAVVLIDFPGFNWWVARRAHARGIPVVYFVPPQLWGWAGWRVRKMRRWVDHVLCNLPFEKAWYRDRGVAAHYVGHPYFDALAGQRLDPAFVAEQQSRGGPVVGLLPGSRTHEVEHNLTTLLRAADVVRASRADVRFLVACFKQSHREIIESYLRRHPNPAVEPHVGRTAEIIHLAHCTVAVSGSVGLELLHHGKPSVVVYRVSRVLMGLSRVFLKSPFISLVNLLADRELFPEFLSSRCEADAVAAHVLRWLNEPETYAGLKRELSELQRQVAEPGACRRAAEYVASVVEEQRRPLAA